MNTDIITNYTNDAKRTEATIHSIEINKQLLIGALEIFSASGVMLDQIKRTLFYGSEMSVSQMNTAIYDVVQNLTEVAQGLANLTDTSTININPRTFHSIIGIATEAAELTEAMNIGKNEPEDIVNILEESFDVDYYQLILLDQLNANLFDTWNTGFDKLKSRYPDKFTKENAHNRDLLAERNILEGAYNDEKATD